MNENMTANGAIELAISALSRIGDLESLNCRPYAQYYEAIEILKNGTKEIEKKSIAQCYKCEKCGKLFASSSRCPRCAMFSWNAHNVSRARKTWTEKTVIKQVKTKSEPVFTEIGDKNE